jgi:hypothetical protein
LEGINSAELVPKQNEAKKKIANFILEKRKSKVETSQGLNIRDIDEHKEEAKQEEHKHESPDEEAERKKNIMTMKKSYHH